MSNTRPRAVATCRANEPRTKCLSVPSRIVQRITCLALPGAVVLGCFLLWGPAAALAAPAKTVFNGPRDIPQVALTFDDNYSGPRANSVIKTLEKTRTPATMFVIGSVAKSGPGLIKAMTEGGFEIGDHSRSHAYLPKLSPSALRIEIGNGTDTVRRQTGYGTSSLIRPPYGATNQKVAEIAGEKGFRYMVLWDIDTNDWRGRSAHDITSQVLREARNGSIILMHINAPHEYEALPGTIKGLRARGFKLVTVSELLKGNRPYFDVSAKSADGKAIVRVVEAGVMDPISRDYFGPLDPLTTVELATIDRRVQVAAGRRDLGGDSMLAGDTSTAVGVDTAASGATADTTTSTARKTTGSARETPVATRLDLADTLSRLARDLYGYPLGAVRLTDKPSAILADVPSGASDMAGAMVAMGLMNARTVGPGGAVAGARFDPWGGVTRLQAARAVDRLIALRPSPGLLTPFLLYQTGAIPAFGS